jgi:hypothetical protein
MTKEIKRNDLIKRNKEKEEFNFKNKDTIDHTSACVNKDKIKELKV